jgi:D-inositol-3-phosphate glycosyltransferase
LKVMCEEAGVSDLITFLGKRGQDTLPYYYSAADAVVMPSFYESFGMVALEAMACGTPVVASQVGGLAFLVQDGITGFTVPVDDPEALAERLTELVQDHQLRHTMSTQAVALAHQFGWERIAERVIALYENVIAKGQPSTRPLTFP